MRCQNRQVQKSTDKTSVEELKHIIHESFMQISEMERLCSIELEQKKQELQLREKAIELRQIRLNAKLTSLQGHSNASCSFLDSSRIEQLGPMQLQESQFASVRNLHALLDQGEDQQMQRYLQKIQLLGRQVTHEIGYSSDSLLTLVQIARQVCLDNLRLVQQLLNTEQSSQILQKKVTESGMLIAQLKTKHIDAQKQIARLRQQLRKIEIEKNPAGYHKLSDSRQDNSNRNSLETCRNGTIGKSSSLLQKDSKSTNRDTPIKTSAKQSQGPIVTQKILINSRLSTLKARQQQQHQQTSIAR